MSSSRPYDLSHQPTTARCRCGHFTPQQPFRLPIDVGYAKNRHINAQPIDLVACRDLQGLQGIRPAGHSRRTPGARAALSRR
jgi:hypothetical protein